MLLLELPDELDEPVELAELDRDLLLELPLVLPDELDKREKRAESRQERTRTRDQDYVHVGLLIYRVHCTIQHVPNYNSKCLVSIPSSRLYSVAMQSKVENDMTRCHVINMV